MLSSAVVTGGKGARDALEDAAARGNHFSAPEATRRTSNRAGFQPVTLEAIEYVFLFATPVARAEHLRELFERNLSCRKDTN